MRQRSLQNGRHFDSATQTTSRWQVGQRTRGASIQQVTSWKVTSPGACVAREASPFQVRKRTLQR